MKTGDTYEMPVLGCQPWASRCAALTYPKYSSCLGTVSRPFLAQALLESQDHCWLWKRISKYGCEWRAPCCSKVSLVLQEGAHVLPVNSSTAFPLSSDIHVACDLCVKETGHQDVTSVLQFVLQLCDWLLKPSWWALGSIFMGKLLGIHLLVCSTLAYLCWQHLNSVMLFFFQHLLKYNSYSQVLDGGVVLQPEDSNFSGISVKKDVRVTFIQELAQNCYSIPFGEKLWEKQENKSTKTLLGAITHERRCKPFFEFFLGYGSECLLFFHYLAVILPQKARYTFC